MDARRAAANVAQARMTVSDAFKRKLGADKEEGTTPKRPRPTPRPAVGSETEASERDPFELSRRSRVGMTPLSMGPLADHRPDTQPPVEMPAESSEVVSHPEPIISMWVQTPVESDQSAQTPATATTATATHANALTTAATATTMHADAPPTATTATATMHVNAPTLPPTPAMLAAQDLRMPAAGFVNPPASPLLGNTTEGHAYPPFSPLTRTSPAPLPEIGTPAMHPEQLHALMTLLQADPRYAGLVTLLQGPTASAQVDALVQLLRVDSCYAGLLGLWSNPPPAPPHQFANHVPIAGPSNGYAPRPDV